MLEEVQNGKLSVDDALKKMKYLPFEDLDFAKLDHHRSLRKACGEVIYCPSKTKEQILSITKTLLAKKSDVFLSRADENMYKEVKKLNKNAVFNPHCKSIIINDGWSRIYR